MRLLVLTYYFPPSGGAGVQRVLKWVKYLPALGIEPTVLTVREGAYPQLDPSLRSDVPGDVNVVRTRALDPFGAYAMLTGRERSEAVAARTDSVGSEAAGPERLARWLRANVFVPDARVGWVPFAVARGLRLHRREAFGAILSSGPPHSVHLAGRLLSRLTGAPWLADFRDPWTGIHYYDTLPRTPAVTRLEATLERGVLRSANRVIAVSPSLAGHLAHLAGRPVGVVYNGFDPADFAGPTPPRPDVFTIVHVGSLYDARDPHALWAALAEIRRQQGGGRFRVRVVGRYGEGVRMSAQRAGVDDLVEWAPYVPHAEAVAEMRRATVLLLSSEPHEQEAGHVTGKVFEYLGAGRPVLGLGDPTGDAATLLAETGAGRMLGRDDVEGVKAHLSALYERWEAGEPLGGANPAAAARYARPRQAEEIASYLRGMTARTPSDR